MDRTESGTVDAARFWRSAPPRGATDDDWYAFLQDISGEFVRAIREIDEQFKEEPYKRLEEVRRLRREHHLLVVADRVRREAENGRSLGHEDLRKAAETIVDRTARVVASVSTTIQPRSHAEAKMLNSANVHWHKLIHRAGSRAELRGGWRDRTKVRGTKVIGQKIMRQRPAIRTQLLREHICERLEQLAALSSDVCAMPDSRVTRQDRLLIRELGLLVQRAYTAAKQDPEAALALAKGRRKRRRQSLGERQSDASVFSVQTRESGADGS